MLRPYPIDQVNRIALTPQMDGVIAPEEWEGLAADTFFQWEPDTLYWAAKAQQGQDIVMSLDYHGDGWLVGDDNIEFRCRHTGDTVTLTMRRLDATDPNGPKWTDRDLIPQSFRAAVTTDGNVWALESAWTPIFDQAPAEGKIMGIRIDTTAPTEESSPAYLPRTMGFVGLRWDNSDKLFTGLSWRPMFKVRSVARDDGVRVKYEFTQGEDCPLFKSVAFRGEGLAADEISSMTNPFPPFNNKGKTAVDYNSKISQTATAGYRVLRATVTAADGSVALLRSSFRISDLVDFDIRLPRTLAAKAEAQIVRGSVVLDSQGFGRVEGIYSVVAPPEWTMTKGKEEKFMIYHSRGTARMPFEMVVPNGARGVFPLTFKAVVGDRTMEKTIFIPVR